MEWLRENISSYGGDIDALIIFIAVVVGVAFLIAEFILFSYLWKYRKSKNPKSEYITGETKEDMKWISRSHAIVLAFDIVILVLAIKVWNEVKIDKPEADEKIRVVGHQWAWKFVHPGEDKELGTEDDVETVDELHIKVGKTYHFILESNDVMHSFSIPVFRLKQDAVPGRAIEGWFKAEKTGTFDIQCAEMCGIGHGIMGAVLKVEEESEHIQWLRSQRTGV